MLRLKIFRFSCDSRQDPERSSNNLFSGFYGDFLYPPVLASSFVFLKINYLLGHTKKVLVLKEDVASQINYHPTHSVIDVTHLHLTLSLDEFHTSWIHEHSVLTGFMSLHLQNTGSKIKSRVARQQ